ncbi:vacuolar protein sorting protein vps66 [Histomonas meleagridis]|uniref:vacuolar protein sorting protein vps66 n=1 Tax=Histomonas meleagridis TaxID=135588 RepID=UPI003559F4BE|nr:vacuolar protein sorting protein vps66 [Histomonas meleagridis]KAH0805230.1 vacuolar protein sorting protein vps66 [Histomonas meleagridis]
MCGIAYRVMLFLTGLFTIYVQPTSVTDRFSAVAENRDPESGDIIIANCSSYLNILWLQSTYNPIFAIPVSPTEVVTKTIHQLLNEILSVKPLTKGRKITFTQLIEYAKKEQKPIVLFPEAAVTNGKCVIKFQTFGQDTDFSDTRFHIFGFVHFDGKLNPNFTKGPGLYHLFLMIGRIVSGLKVKVVEESEIPKLENNKIDAKWISKCRNILATIMGVPMVDVDGMEIDNSGVKKVHKD